MDVMPDPLEPALPRIIIRNAAWLVAWDNAAQSHCYRRDVDLAIDGETFAAIGPAAPADHRDPVEIDGRGFAILPGFVDIHAHPSSEPMLKGLTDEVGSHQLYMSSLYEYLPLFEADAEGRRAATEVALCELMHRRFVGIPPNQDASGEIEQMGLLAGQGVGLVAEILPAADLVRKIADEARIVIAQRLGQPQV
jgi:hypothetical protein